MVAWLEESGKLCRKALNRKVTTRWRRRGGGAKRRHRGRGQARSKVRE